MSKASKRSAVAFLFSCLETAFNSLPLAREWRAGVPGCRRPCGSARSVRAPAEGFPGSPEPLPASCSASPGRGFFFPSVSIPVLRGGTPAMLQLEAHERLQLRAGRTDCPLQRQTGAKDKPACGPRAPRRGNEH